MKNKHTYDPLVHHRRSIRLQGYDYSQAGLFFITVCVNNRICLFGEIINNEMVLNDAGAMIEKWYVELENKFNDIKCHEYVVMPNHFHCIIENAGADLCVRPKNFRADAYRADTYRADTQVRPYENEPVLGQHPGSPLGTVLQWFKTMSTNEYIRKVKSDNWPRFDGKL